MGNFAKTFCRLCLNVISDGNFKVIEETIEEVLEILLVKLCAEEITEPVICIACSTTVLAAFQFKATCMDTEDSIFPYVNSENVASADLREIYLKIRGKEHLRAILEEERICRLCMQMNTSGFTSVEDVETDMIQKCIPEINFDSTKEPVVCAGCLDSLNAHSSLIRKCLDVEEQIKNVHGNKENLFCVKTDEIEIKSEEPDNDSDSALRNDHEWTIQRKGNLKLNLYKCYACDLKYKHRSNLSRHQKSHKDIPRKRLHKCDTCNFKTYRKDHLTRHQLKHKSPSEVQMYHCNTCDFKTKYKGSLTNHLLSHEDYSKESIYECQSCGIKYRHKSSLSRHKLIHKRINKRKKYECITCGFKAKRKDHLTRHQLKHESLAEVQMYKCDTCDFVACNNYILTRHQLKNTNIRLRCKCTTAIHVTSELNIKDLS
ncbi:zinc finger protein 286A-like [Anoplophora glabripennis]|uniref:zinc finger protein 286A-like n=1 Tax=Anoplophora glabripennis TaxID=217634 RepID=UPI000874D193|nr:zinc finger protein 286A-like [Anoplophora glabripennis]